MTKFSRQEPLIAEAKPAVKEDAPPANECITLNKRAAVQLARRLFCYPRLATIAGRVGSGASGSTLSTPLIQS